MKWWPVPLKHPYWPQKITEYTCNHHYVFFFLQKLEPTPEGQSTVCSSGENSNGDQGEEAQQSVSIKVGL